MSLGIRAFQCEPSGAVARVVAAEAARERCEAARQLGERKRVKGRWSTERAVHCLLGETVERDWEREEGWLEDGYTTCEKCNGKPVVLGTAIIPACSLHLAAWARTVGLDWAARQGVIPFDTRHHARVVDIFYPCDPRPSRSPRPASRSGRIRSSYVEVESDEFEVLLDAMHEIGAPAAKLFTLSFMYARAPYNTAERAEIIDEWLQERDAIWAGMEARR